MPWLAVAAAGIGAGLSAYSNSKKKKTVDMIQYPEYPESEEARKAWWERLQEWGEDPNYGAVTPDWDNIWNLTQRKIKEYYSGTALTPGVKDKLKASLARRNLSDSPAYDYMLMASDVEQGKQLEEAAVQEGIQKTNLAEGGRQTWLQSLQNLVSQKPNYYTTEGVSGGIPWMDITGSTLSTLGTVGTQYLQGQEQNSLLENLINKQLPQQTPSNISSSPRWLDTSAWRS